MDFQGKHIWLIGASFGIGAAVAEVLAEQGAILALSGRDETQLKEVQYKLKGHGHLVVPLDVTQPDAQKGAVQTIQQVWPKLDMAIYNAGTYQPMGAHNLDIAAVDRMLDVNLRGAFYFLDATLPLFTAQGSGHLVLVASVAAYRGLPNAMGYAASKAGLLSLAESLRAELADKQIKVQVVNPGFVKTRMTDVNEFPMPFMISAESAAQSFVAGLNESRFEIRFPWFFTTLMKCLARLPYRVYFMIAKRLV